MSSELYLMRYSRYVQIGHSKLLSTCTRVLMEESSAAKLLAMITYT